MLITTVVYALVCRDAAASRCSAFAGGDSAAWSVGLQRRVTGGILGPTITHSVWSLGMLFLLPPALAACSPEAGGSSPPDQHVPAMLLMVDSSAAVIERS